MDPVKFLSIHTEDFIQLNQKDKWKVELNWKKAFLSVNKKLTGKYNRTDQLLWDALSTDCLNGARAEEEYEKVSDSEFFFGISYRSDWKIYSCIGIPPGLLIIRNELNNFDIYIFSKKYKWTFITTHEQNYSSDPYFRYSQNFE